MDSQTKFKNQWYFPLVIGALAVVFFLIATIIFVSVYNYWNKEVIVQNGHGGIKVSSTGEITSPEEETYQGL